MAQERDCDQRHDEQQPVLKASLTVAIGDGSLNCLAYEAGYRRVFEELARVLRPGGRIAIRMYLTPEDCESVDVVRARTMAGNIKGIHGLKWLLANALCAARNAPNLAVQDILATFNRVFPDRAALARATGWSVDDIAQIDSYIGLPDVFSFPTAPQVLALVPEPFASAHFVAAGTYELAERCPILVMDVKP